MLTSFDFMDAYCLEIGVAFLCFGLLLFVIDTYLLTLSISPRQMNFIAGGKEKEDSYRLLNEKSTMWEFLKRHLVQLLYYLIIFGTASFFLTALDRGEIVIGVNSYKVSWFSLLPSYLFFYCILNFFFAFLSYHVLKFNVKLNLSGAMEELYALHFNVKLKPLANRFPREQFSQHKIISMIAGSLLEPAYLTISAGVLIVLFSIWITGGNYKYITEIQFACLAISFIISKSSLKGLLNFLDECIRARGEKVHESLLRKIAKHCIMIIFTIVILGVGSFLGMYFFDKYLSLT